MATELKGNLYGLSDAEKLSLLADWLDDKYPDDPTPEIQKDLRETAQKLKAWGGNIPGSIKYNPLQEKSLYGKFHSPYPPELI